MKTRSCVRILIRAYLTLFCFWYAADTRATSIATPFNSPDMYVLISRYDVQATSKEQVGKALGTYVQLALADENNVMAEVFQEEEHALVLWVLERWNSADNYKKFHESPTVNELLSSRTELLKPAKTYHLKDVAPLTKSEWRRAPANGDQPIVIMLFVDGKPGTETDFTKVYHAAMPKFRSEPGVITYGLSQSVEDKTQFVTYEKFRNEDAFQYHLKFPPIQPVLDYLNTSIKKQPFQDGLHRLVPLSPS